MKSLVISILPGLLVMTIGESCKTRIENTPNIIYILADDLGYGDPGCYGQERFATPHLDRLAGEGMRFTQHYAGSTVCAPSRSSLMTGEHTGHTPIRGNNGWDPEGQWPLPDESWTLAEMLQEKGYVTGAFGKWGLGFVGTTGDPNRQGFDEFYGFNCQSLAHNYYSRYLWHNQEKVILEENEGDKTGIYTPELIHRKALEFIETNSDTCFFLYYPSIIPHAELFAPEEYVAKFRGKYLPEKVYEGIDGGDRYRLGPYGSQPESHAVFAAMVSLLDQQVGEIVAKIRELGLEDNTLILFSSDNGPHLEGGADPDYFNSNGGLKGYKRDLYEGGIRVPMIAWWPGRIAPGTESDHVSAFWDILPTIADLLGTELPGKVDGISFLPTLLGEKGQKDHAFLYWEFHERNGRQAVRRGDWKLVRYNVFEPDKTSTELFNLSDDRGEERDLSKEFPEKVEELMEILFSARTETGDFPFENR